MNKKLFLKYKNQEISGVLLKEDKDYITLKLDSGYNSILKKTEFQILKEELLKINKFENSNKNSLNKNSLNIKILHTGGTIASKVDYKTGAVSSKFTPDELLNLYPSLLKKVNLSAEMIGNLFSEDMRFSHYNLILDKIKQAIEIEKVDGIIISHGTDTLGYTAPALQYAISNLSIPIMLVGAQRSSDRPSSDAYSNLDAAIDFIIFNNSQENSYNRVGACMHKTISDDEFIILDSINLKKLHSTRRDAFKQINYSHFAEISKNHIEVKREELLSKKIDKKLIINKYNEDLKIGFFKAHPNLFPQEISALSIYDGIIIEGTGLGHIGINEVDIKTKIHNSNFEELKKISNKIPTIMSVQTVFGEVNMNVYSTGRYLQEIGIKGNHLNLISETLFIRLAFILSNKKDSFDEIWNSNLEKFQIRNVNLD